jgi:malonate-semialdehyde dehydrogenase (acetylating)/methylmalonate-semialdehyde dehydrogenase
MMLATRLRSIRSNLVTAAAFSTQPIDSKNDSPPQRFKYDAPWLHYYTNHKHPDVMNFINGSFQHPNDANMKFSDNIECSDPSTNKVLSYIPESSSKQDDASTTPSSLEQAIAAAKGAYPSWSSTPVQTRQRLLLEYAHFLHKKEVREEIAYWITLENGKTMADAMGDVWRGLEVVEAATRVGNDMMVS